MRTVLVLFHRLVWKRECTYLEEGMYVVPITGPVLLSLHKRVTVAGLGKRDNFVSHAYLWDL